jgi:hypothetical protein
MLRLTDQDVAEFRRIYRMETGKDLSDEEARACAERLVQFVAFLTGASPLPLPSE